MKPNNAPPENIEAIIANREAVAKSALKCAQEEGAQVSPEGLILLYHGTRSGDAIRKSGCLRMGSYLSDAPAIAKRFAMMAQGGKKYEVIPMSVDPRAVFRGSYWSVLMGMVSGKFADMTQWPYRGVAVARLCVAAARLCVAAARLCVAAARLCVAAAESPGDYASPRESLEMRYQKAVSNLGFVELAGRGRIGDSLENKIERII